MKLTPTSKKWRRVARGAVLASSILLGVSQAPSAMADTLLLADTTLVKGSSTATFSFDAPSGGTVTATVSNLAWPTNLATLQFSATSASDVIKPWAPVTDPTKPLTESFQVGAGTYFAHIMATAGQGDLDLGLYSLNLTFSPNAVPLPTSGWMLLSGVLVLFGLTRVMGMFARLQAPRQEVAV
jgi:hypothetical protein